MNVLWKIVKVAIKVVTILPMVIDAWKATTKNDDVK